MTTLIALLLSTQDVAWKTSWPDALKEAKASGKMAVLYFTNAGVKDCVRFESEALQNTGVVLALKAFVCAKIDPEGPDADNKLWQDHGGPRLPMTFVYDPEGKRLVGINTLNATNYAGLLNAAKPAYFDKIKPAKDSLASNPAQADKLVMLGEAYLALDNSAESGKNYDAAVEILAKKGDSAGALKILENQVATFYAKKWYGPARNACKKILELDPSDTTKVCSMASWVLGMADCDDRKWNDAISGLTSACAKYKDSKILDKMMFTLASAYMYSGDKASAIRTFEEIVLKFPESDSVNIARTQIEKLKK